uniref:Uncharacterized protein n=1 Tax=uncultured Desulfobacterium sp. TaxID=201089 RepID=E1YGN6_9BACT|nr:unknown protein [uncultured Desulfobacterium sp.]
MLDPPIAIIDILSKANYKENYIKFFVEKKLQNVNHQFLLK